MHTAECSTPSIERDVALHQLRIETAFLELLPAPGPCEEAAIIVPRLEIDLENTSQFRLSKYHREPHSIPLCRLVLTMARHLRAGVPYARMNGEGQPIEMPTVHQIQPLQDPRWGAFLERHTRASAFHTVAWLQALQRTYGYKPLAYTTSPPDSALQNAMLFCLIDSWLTGRRLVSLPFSDYCDPLFASHTELNVLLPAMEHEVHRQNVRYIEIRPKDGPTIVNTSLFQSNRDYWLHHLDLTQDLDTIFSSFHKASIQRKIRRAEREGLIRQHGRSEFLLDAFCRLNLLTRRRHHVPPQPRKWFENLIDCFGQALSIHVAFKDTKPLAAILIIRYKDTVVYKYGASDGQHHNLGGTHLLFWRAIQDAKTDHAKVFDFGRSDHDDTGLITFKDRWGCERSTLTYSRFTPSAQSEDSYLSNTQARRLVSARRALDILPDGAFQLVGSLLYKHMG